MAKQLFYTLFILFSFLSIFILSTPIRPQSDYEHLSKEARKLYFKSCYTEKSIYDILSCYDLKQKMRGGNKVQIAIQEILLLFPQLNIVLIVILGIYVVCILVYV